MTAHWTAPGAGQWRRDDSHHTHALTRYLAELLVPGQLAGFAAGFREVGSMLDGFDVQWVHGRAYQRPRIVGAPKLPIWGDRPPATIKPPGKPPPRFVFKVLFALHPELRRRARRAAAVWETRAWRELARRWHDEQQPAAIASLCELQRLDVEALGDPELATHLARLTQELRDAIVEHFVHATYHAIVMGDFIVHACAWSGAAPGEVLAALHGASPASRAGAVETANIAAAIAREPALRAVVESERSAAEVVAVVCAAPGAAGAALTRYLDHHGLRLVTGLDLYHQPLVELPDVIVRGLRAMLDAPPRDAPRDPLAGLRARTPASHHAELEAAYAEAATMYGVRDENTGLLLWRLGLLRRALRATGRRLAARGAIHDADDIYDLGPDEVLAALRGQAAPTADELRARVECRRGFDVDEPPVALGEAGPMPDPAVFPPAVARMQRAVSAFLASFEGERTAGDITGVRGTGASSGTYEGRARVVRGPDDFARIEAGDVLIARHTSPAYNVVLPLLGAIVTDRGGVLSHAAIVAREYGIPAVVDTRNATTRIADGDRVRVDGTTGSVEVTAQGDGAAFAMAAAAPIAIPIPDEPPDGGAVPSTVGQIAPLRNATATGYGGKARALASALRAGLPVPDGIALDADLVDRIVRGDRDAIARATAACRDLASPWAIRSSAVGEDSAQASFAGQHATVLGVRSPQLIDAIGKVAASAHAGSALAYRQRMGVVGAPRMGVVVQTLLQPQVSGVLFSHDPTASREGRVIEATWGLGEALVSGLVTPDRYRIGVAGNLLERMIGDKDLAVEARADGGTSEIAIGSERARSACLDDDRLAELAGLATQCEQLFGGPQDLEWAVAGGRLHLLQSRPITTR